VHLDARGDPDDRDSISRRFVDVARRSIAATKQEEFAPSFYASFNGSSGVG